MSPLLSDLLVLSNCQLIIITSHVSAPSCFLVANYDRCQLIVEASRHFSEICLVLSYIRASAVTGL